MSHELLLLPFTGHVFDVWWGALGTQTTRQAVADFLADHVTRPDAIRADRSSPSGADA